MGAIVRYHKDILKDLEYFKLNEEILDKISRITGKRIPLTQNIEYLT